MSINEIKKLLEIGANQNVEYCENYDKDDAGKNICAFLNSGGGFIVYADSQNYAEGHEYNVYGKITPKALVSLEKKKLKEQTILVFEVPAGKDIPYSYKNVMYIRSKNKTEPADIETIKDMIVRKQNEPIRWERRFSDAEFETDFDSNHFGSVINGIIKTNRIKLQTFNNTADYLNYFSLYSYGKLTNACDVLFCKNPAQRLPQIRAKAALFANDKTDSTYLDMKNFEGPLLEIFNELYNFIFRNTPTLTHFPVNSPIRQDIPIYPRSAIREGLINALVHRDYSDYKGSVSVFIYSDRLEIWNSGELPEGVTVESLTKGNVSVLRNPDISYIMYLQEYMERLGRGANLIKKLCAESGLPEPKWKSEKGLGVTLTFFAPNTGRIPADSGSKPAEPSLKPSDTGGLATDYGLENEKERRISDRLRPITTDLTKQDKKILEFIKLHKQFVLKEIEKLLDVKESRAREIMRKMTKRNIVRKIQQGKNTFYVSAI